MGGWVDTYRTLLGAPPDCVLLVLERLKELPFAG